MSGGWFKYFRSGTENELYFSERFTRWHAWIDLLTLASYSERTVFIRGIRFELSPGDMLESQKTLARRWKWSNRTVVKFLKFLSERDQISIRVHHRISVITIVNWGRYQALDGEGEPQSAPQNALQSAPAIRRDKKGKEDICFTLARSLLLVEDEGVYAVINKFKSLFGGPERLMRQLGKILSGDTRFTSAGNLAAYLNACLRNNGHSKKPELKVDSLPEIAGDSPQYVDG